MIQVEISGHTDSNGVEAYNFALSQKRAKAVYDYLVNLGVKANKMIFKGYGDSSPLIDENPASPANRRIDFKILSVN